jgi:hypothetical protein
LLICHHVPVAVVLPKSLAGLLSLQAGVLTHGQALERGLSKPEVARLVRGGHWQRLHRGVYYAHNNRVPRRAQLWGAVLRTGHGAVLSHETAAEVWKISGEQAAVIHVSVPRKTGPVPAADGVRVHYSSRLPRGEFGPAVGYGMPPVTTAEEVVFDLAGTAATAEEAVNWAIRACQHKTTTPDLIGMCFLEPGHRDLRWGADLRDALGEIREGVASPLERRYLRDVEQAHQLPVGVRQVKTKRGATVRYHDVRYPDYGVGVELDGMRYHQAGARDNDRARDNESALDGVVTLRYGWAPVAYHPCEVAREVWALLAQRGYRGEFLRCPRCAAREPSPAPSAARARGDGAEPA